MSRPRIPKDHDELRRNVLNATKEHPLTVSMIERACFIFSNDGRHQLRNMLRNLVDSGELETWENYYCNMQQVGGVPLYICPI